MAYRTLIFETNLGGHRGNFVQLLAGELLRLGVEVHLVLPANWEELEAGASLLSKVEPHVATHTLSATQTGMPRVIAKRRLQQLAESMRQVKPDHVYVPYADGLAQTWGMAIRPSRVLDKKDACVEGLMMRGSFAYPSPSWKEGAARRANRMALARAPWDRLHQLDPIPYQRIMQSESALAAITRLIPEPIEPKPVETKDACRKWLGLPSDRRVVMCPGVVDERKGVDRLIDAFADSAIATDSILYLLGAHSSKIRNLLRERHAELVRRGTIISHDRFATPEEFQAMFGAADCVVLGYPRHIGSASILLRAAKTDVRILASDWGWLGWAARTFSLGETFDATDHQSFVGALGSLDSVKAKFGSNERRQRFLAYHTVENHLSHWTSLLRERTALEAGVIAPWPFRLNGDKSGRLSFFLRDQVVT